MSTETDTSRAFAGDVVPSRGLVVNNSPGASAHRKLKEWIAEGRLPPGESLPPQQMLAELLGVGRTSVRYALKHLAEEGLIEGSRGRGWAVTSGGPRSRSIVTDSVGILTNIPGPSTPRGRGLAGSDIYMQAGIQEAARGRGLHVVTLDPAWLASLPEGMSRGELPRGVVVMDGVAATEAGRQGLAALRSAGVEVVLYADAFGMDGVDCVVSDQERGSYELAKWLLERGAKRVLRLWWLKAHGSRPDWLVHRNAGFERAMKEASLKPPPPVEFKAELYAPSARERLEAGSRLAYGYLAEHLQGKKHVDAIVVSSDGETFAVAEACRRAGRAPNKDVLITGYDNYWAECEERQWTPYVPSATVDKRNVETGHELVKLLMERIDGALPPEPVRRTVAPELRVVDGGASGPMRR